MSIIISNICCKNAYDIDFLDLIKKHNINEIEISFTKIVGDWSLTKDDILKYNNFIKNNNISIYSCQSILHLININIFEEKNFFIQHMEKVLYFCSLLDIKIIVFGCPKNRYVKNNDDYMIFLDIFDKIGDLCKKYNITLCIEPNSKKYGCNFITNSKECFKILKILNHQNIKMHLDAACMFLEDDNGLEKNEIVNLVKHFHISNINLCPIHIQNELPNINYNNNLIKYNFSGKKSIEMLSSENYLDDIEKSIIFSKKYYI